MTAMKVCSKCCTEKSTRDFYNKSNGSPESQCKSCRKASMDAKREKHFVNNQTINYEGVKECTDCQTVVLKTEFDIRRHSPDGLSPRCKRCQRQRNQGYYSSVEGQLTHKVVAARNRAESKERAFDIDNKFITELFAKQGGLCALTGLPMRSDDVGTSAVRGYDSPSIDRIDSKAGYTTDNVRLVLQGINIAKSVWSDSDLAQFAADFLQHRDYTVTTKETV